MEKQTKKNGMTELLRVRALMTKVAEFMPTLYGSDEVIDELMTLRGYTSTEMRETLKAEGVFRVNYISDFLIFADTLGITLDDMVSMGFIPEASLDSYVVVGGRFTLPIRDLKGSVVAFVGWFPDNKKYITTPSFGFCRETSFYNSPALADALRTDSVIYLVEGIFDTLSVKSLGFNVVGNMGLKMSAVKRIILSRFSRVVAIFDNDSAGKKVFPLGVNRGGKGLWEFSGGTYVRIDGERLSFTGAKIKDIDDLIKHYDCKEELKALSQKRGFSFLH